MMNPITMLIGRSLRSSGLVLILLYAPNKRERERISTRIRQLQAGGQIADDAFGIESDKPGCEGELLLVLPGSDWRVLSVVASGILDLGYSAVNERTMSSSMYRTYCGLVNAARGH